MGEGFFYGGYEFCNNFVRNIVEGCWVESREGGVIFFFWYLG
jgi:hypothetical protein